MIVAIRPDNLVPRPWGGQRLADFKGLPPRIDNVRYGESFEVSAFPADPEAAAHPSVVVESSGQSVGLPAWLAADPEARLGAAHLARFGTVWPLLPKLLDVSSLLSVQAHPPGHPEAYFVLEADEAATIGVGWREDVSRDVLLAMLSEGRSTQERLLAALGPATDPNAVHGALAPWLADRQADLADGVARLGVRRAGPAAETLATLQRIYWGALDRIHALPVRAGDVILNATPADPTAPEARTAEVHALGNPQGREVLALEVRKPGPTFRAWDNVRFPMRPIDVGRALDAMSLRARPAASFYVEPMPVPSAPGVFRSVTTALFEVEHLRATVERAVDAPTWSQPHTLHTVRGDARVEWESGVLALPRGASAFVEFAAGPYRVSGETEVLRVRAP